MTIKLTLEWNNCLNENKFEGGKKCRDNSILWLEKIVSNRISVCAYVRSVLCVFVRIFDDDKVI